MRLIKNCFLLKGGAPGLESTPRSRGLDATALTEWRIRWLQAVSLAAMGYVLT